MIEARPFFAALMGKVAADRPTWVVQSETVDVWIACLSDLEPTLILRATATWLQRGSEFPNAGKIRQVALEIEAKDKGEALEPAEAWSRALAACRRYGYRGEQIQQALAMAPPAVQDAFRWACVADYGDTTTGPERAAIQKRFLEAYEQATRKRREHGNVVSLDQLGAWGVELLEIAMGQRKAIPERVKA